MVSLSFEGIGDLVFQDENKFSNKFLKLIYRAIKHNEKNEKLINLLKMEIEDLEDLSDIITEFVRISEKEVILIIDEVDKSSNNQLFLSFIGMLRNKYLLREAGKDYTFKSVILAGLHDVKNLKLKLRKEEETKYNSPWNIAVDFNVDMSFSSEEIATMLEDYCNDNELIMDIEMLSKEVFFFTNGYPYLVSRLCQIIDEIIYVDNKKSWSIADIQNAVKILLEERNTLFDSVIKNLENNNELYQYIYDLIVNGFDKNFNNYNPIIEIGIIYGYFKNTNGKVTLSNKIFSEIIYNYMVSKLENNYSKIDEYNFKTQFLETNGGLNIEKILYE